MRSFAVKAQAQLERLKSERGATDPILVIASIAITLVLLLGGTFMITGVVTNAKNLNATGDLDKVAVVEASLYSSGTDAFSIYDSVTNKAPLEHPTSGVGFSPTSGGKLAVTMFTDTGGNIGWVAISRSSATGNPIYVRTSFASKFIPVDAAGVPIPTGGLSSAAMLASIGAVTADMNNAITALGAVTPANTTP